MSKILLFVPAHNDKFIANAKALKKKHKDLQLVYDLEDSVPADKKKDAFNKLTDKKSKILGVNDWIRVDPTVFQSYNFNYVYVEGIMLPKVEKVSDLDYWLDTSDSYHHKHKIIALIETAAGVENVRKIAKKVHGIMFGKVDLAASLGSDAFEDFARKRVVLACKAVGVPVYDTPSCSVDDVTIHNHVARSYDYGFDGIGILHPKEIPIVKQMWKPSSEKLTWAKAVLEAYKKDYVAIVNGEIIGTPSVKRAKQILEIK